MRDAIRYGLGGTSIADALATLGFGGESKRTLGAPESGGSSGRDTAQVGFGDPFSTAAPDWSTDLPSYLDLVSDHQTGRAPESQAGFGQRDGQEKVGDAVRDALERIAGRIDDSTPDALEPVLPNPNDNDQGPDGETPGLAALRALLTRRFNAPLVNWNPTPSNDPKRIRLGPDPTPAGPPAKAPVVPVSPNDEPDRIAAADAGWRSATDMRTAVWGGHGPRPVDPRALAAALLLISSRSPA